MQCNDKSISEDGGDRYRAAWQRAHTFLTEDRDIFFLIFPIQVLGYPMVGSLFAPQPYPLRVERRHAAAQ